LLEIPRENSSSPRKRLPATRFLAEEAGGIEPKGSSS